MRALLQRVSRADVRVDEKIVASIRKGILVLLGIAKSDGRDDADYILEKILGLRIFPDMDGKMNLNVQQSGGELLIVSQFTLMGDCRRGRRPSFDRAALPVDAENLYDYFVERARHGPVPAGCGHFQRHMEVELVNDGPVTILIDSADRSQ